MLSHSENVIPNYWKRIYKKGSSMANISKLVYLNLSHEIDAAIQTMHTMLVIILFFTGVSEAKWTNRPCESCSRAGSLP